ncbi:DUF998 domain-containing protein [Maritalea porphyrae]|uniref:DUF998 domain-containing protein n=1 Tax=Maritalea porphyrae TaxID=880732 RepID=A0ABQ5UN83_9HYPH|nr:DUF998 domain-containing protein [Maritalea porphyrae]GLQ16678.1 hypothetical protein GCM10007879_09270 [Maritalea porphyrae]
MTRSRLMIALAIASYFWLAGSVLLGGINYPNYSHISQFMSELGATGSPIGPYMNLFGFIGTEILLLLGLAIAWQLLPKNPATLIGFAFLLAYPILIGIAALSPCDFQCRPKDPTLSHTIHIITGLLAYFTAILGLAILSWQQTKRSNSTLLKRITIFLTPVLLILLLALTPDNPIVGAVQRLAETIIYLWLVTWLFQLANDNQTTAS